MLVAERHAKIVDILNEKGSIRVTELSQIFRVTEETIRRDLERLEAEGKLCRSHGGAIRCKENTSEPPYFEREVIHVEEKMEVAREALQYIKPYDRIILDASSTAWYMAKILPDLPLTVLTNSMKVGLELANKEKISVIVTGGKMLTKSLSFVGPLTETALDEYRVNKVFMSCQGIDREWGVSDSNEMQAIVKKKFMSVSNQVYLLVDNSKFGIKSFSRVSSLAEIDFIITDSKTDNSQVQLFREAGIEVKRSRALKDYSLKK